MATYHRTTTISREPPSLKGKSTEEAFAIVENHLRVLAKNLGTEHTNLERTSVGSTTVTIVQAQSGSSGGGGGGSSSLLFRAGKQAVTPAGTLVSFSSAISGSFILLYRCYDASNASVGADVSAVTTSGFTITPLMNSTVEYFAIITG